MLTVMMIRMTQGLVTIRTLMLFAIYFYLQRDREKFDRYYHSARYFHSAVQDIWSSYNEQ